MSGGLFISGKASPKTDGLGEWYVGALRRWFQGLFGRRSPVSKDHSKHERWASAITVVRKHWIRPPTNARRMIAETYHTLDSTILAPKMPTWILLCNRLKPSQFGVLARHSFR
jgi:hypothetical protein